MTPVNCTESIQEQTVRKARKHFAAARSMRRNLRLRLYQGRNNGGSANEYHERQGWDLIRDLPRDLEGLLTAEHRLAERISVNRDLGHERPELRARMVDIRRSIRDLTHREES